MVESFLFKFLNEVLCVLSLFELDDFFIFGSFLNIFEEKFFFESVVFSVVILFNLLFFLLFFNEFCLSFLLYMEKCRLLLFLEILLVMVFIIDFF